MLTKIFNNYHTYRYIYFFLKSIKTFFKKYCYIRSYNILPAHFNKYFFIHRGYIFVYRYIINFHKKKKFGDLVVTRKLLNKGMQKNK